MTERLTKGRLKVSISDTRRELGEVAAAEIAGYLNELLASKEEVNIVFASAPSQNDFLECLNTYDIDWSRVNAFHMDEYIGIAPHAPQSFGEFLRARIFSKHRFKSVNYIDSLADPEAECKRYGDLLHAFPIDIVFLGIGENGHLAFNNPCDAFFDDPLTMKTVDLDTMCIQQQINDGCFARIEDVPTRAFTITIPELLFVKKLYAIVPTINKANAIKGTCDGPIVSACPASILRTHRDCTLFVDKDSASLVSRP